MEQAALSITYSYEGVITTTDPLKIGLVLNKILHNPDKALLMEPNINEYWIFYAGGVTFPAGDNDLKHFEINKEQNQNIEISDNTVSNADSWLSEIVKVDELFMFKISEVLYTIQNKKSIIVAVEQPDVKRKLHIYYKK